MLISMPRFKNSNCSQKRPKIKLFLQKFKHCKSPSAMGASSPLQIAGYAPGSNGVKMAVFLNTEIVQQLEVPT